MHTGVVLRPDGLRSLFGTDCCDLTNQAEIK